MLAHNIGIVHDMIRGHRERGIAFSDRTLEILLEKLSAAEADARALEESSKVRLPRLMDRGTSCRDAAAMASEFLAGRRELTTQEVTHLAACVVSSQRMKGGKHA